jgi:pyruvate/2-oxoacid:ferredoxin oxidoreductase beta subunit
VRKKIISVAPSPRVHHHEYYCSDQLPALSEYYSETKCTWCDGRGNYGIRTAKWLVELNLHPWQVCYDVGCHGNGSDKIQGYRFGGLHGRVIPFAAGAKLANMKLPVIAFGWCDFLGGRGALGPCSEEQLSHHPCTAQ